jgi:hypothetical protein
MLFACLRTTSVILTIAVGIGLGTAHSQEEDFQQVTSDDESIDTESTNQGTPQDLFTLGETPVRMWSPVAEPYSNSAYETLGGQPTRSGESILGPGSLGPGG